MEGDWAGGQVGGRGGSGVTGWGRRKMGPRGAGQGQNGYVGWAGVVGLGGHLSHPYPC